MTPDFDLSSVDWAKGGGFVPAIIQDARSLRVLMLGYMNREALDATLSSGFVTFYSRSKQRLWQKGETSGNALKLAGIALDCDKDTFLIAAEPQGPVCHTGARTCFGDAETADLSVLAALAATIRARRASGDADSYTAKLFASGLTRIAQKVGEEGVETALAAATHGANLVEESADLLYHLLVLLEAADLELSDVLRVLLRRAQAKAAR